MDSKIKLLRRVALVVVLCATVSLFTIPVIFYYISAYTGNTDQPTQQFNTSVTVDLYSNTTENKTLNNTNCATTFSWAVTEQDPSTAVCEDYVNTICIPFLTEWRRCLLPGDETAKISVTQEMQADLNDQVITLHSLLSPDNYKSCREAAIPFLCLYYFPLQDCASGDSYSVSQEECVEISTSICAAPWNLAIFLGYGDLLPNCLQLPNEAIVNATEVENELNLTGTATPSQNLNNITCREDFLLVNSTCFPRCDRFEENPHVAIMAMLISEIIAGVLAALISITTLIFSIYNRKNMFTFPSLFLVFFVIDVLIAAILVMTAAIGRNELLCSSNNLIEALENPTVFCTFSGAVFHYISVNWALWWFFHLCFFFYEIMFPFHSHRMKKLGKLKYYATVLVILGLIIPLPGVIVGLSSKENQYRLVRFPPGICTTSEQMWFYSTTLVFIVTVCIGVTFLIVILWRINSLRNNIDKKLKLTTAEKKIMIVSIAFIVFGVYTLVHIGIVTGNADKAATGFKTYFACESTGHVPGACDRRAFERYLYPYMSAIAYILMASIPLAILNFVVNPKDVKKKNPFKRGKGGQSTTTSSGSRRTLVSRLSSDRFSMKSMKQFSTNELPPVDPV